jgi:molybdopterin converting factor small subunit
MKVKVKLMSIFAQYSKSDKDGNTFVKDGGTVLDLVNELGLPAEQVRILTVNGRQSDLSTSLSEGDTIFIFPPAMGGG